MAAPGLQAASWTRPIASEGEQTIFGNRFASGMITRQGQNGRAKGGQDRLVMGWLGFTVALRTDLKAGTGSQRGALMIVATLYPLYYHWETNKVKGNKCGKAGSN